ncbi:MAG TPA: PAS domain S-box protein [Pirellulaceae bacterium]|jgi:PAS domain S-box-containing protein|nr:PAS domain S-box protein [Pirellulaceae bacterium]
MDQLDVQPERAADVSDCAIFVVDASGVVKSWNSAAERMTGYTADEIIGRTISQLDPPEERDGKLPALRHAAARGENLQQDGWRARKDGSRFWGSFSLSPLRNEQGDVTGMVGLARDLTDQQRSGDSARGSGQKFDLLMSGLQEYAVFLMDVSGRVTDWSAAAERLLGYSAHEATGLPFSALWPHEDGKLGSDAERELRTAAEQGRAFDDRWHVRKDGTHFWATGALSALRDQDGTLRGFAKVIADNTERKRLEEELRQRADALEDADRAKNEFLAMLAHELRNPLSPVASAISLLQFSETLDADDREAVAIADRQVKKLARLIDDLMDVSRITRGKVQLQRQRTDLCEIVQNALAAARPAVDEHRHALAARFPDCPLYVSADPTRLEQVFENLVRNACKYTPTGGRIDVVVERNEGTALVRVRDNGVGIAPELLPRIFDLFTQADRSIDRSQGGLGIGLTIVKTLVELHDGSVEAQTGGIGRGSEFIVRLPASIGMVPAEGGEGSQADSNPSRRVLVVDDNPDAARMLAMTLRSEGHEVETALCGFRALEAVHLFRPDVVLLDIALPGLDGFEVARRLREQPTTRNIPLIAVTGYGQPEDRERSRAAGFEFHLVKPVRLKDVMHVFATLDGRV